VITSADRYGASDFWRNLVRAYVRWSPISRGKRFVMDSCAPLYLGSKDLISELPGGARINVDLHQHVQRYIYFFGAYEREMVSWFRRALAPGMTFLDIGAHVGQYSLIAAKAVGPNGRVHAFEPNPGSYRRLTANLALNDFRNAHAHPLALSDVPGPSTLFVPTNNNPGEASLQRCVETTATTTVEVGTADAWMNSADLGEPPRVDLIKIDVQGFERRVLEGAARLLDRFRPTVVCEFEERWLRLAGTSSVELKQVVAGMGYTVHRLTRRGGLAPVALDEIHSFDNLILKPR